MTGEHRPANSNAPAPALAPWAAWSGARSYIAVWSAIACAGIGSWLALQEALLEAGADVMRRQHQALTDPQTGDTADAISAAMDDVRDCSEAVRQAQSDALDALQKSA
jgi:hypothetical protein